MCWKNRKGTKKKAPPLSNEGIVPVVTNVSKHNEDRLRSEKRKGNKKGAEMEEESVGSLKCVGSVNVPSMRTMINSLNASSC